MTILHPCVFTPLICISILCPAQEKRGASNPWKTYEAERMHTTGTVLGPRYEPYRVETESSGQQCVKLAARGQFVEFRPTAPAKAMVIRYSLPDNGRKTELAIYINAKLVRRTELSSFYSWLYGKYPFTNDPAAGSPRHFYDEIRLTGLGIGRGDVVRIQYDKEPSDDPAYCIIDLVDLEDPGPSLPQPPNSLSVADKQFLGDQFTGDYTEAVRQCLVKAVKTGQTVWIPAGTYKITGDILVPSNVTIRGAGMWYTQLVGDSASYTHPDRRVRIKGDGSNIHLADFAIVGNLNYRKDDEANDGIVGSFGENSTISRLWIEHTKVGMWIENSTNLKISQCRMRNTIADGINLCTGMAHSTIENCTARGTGDDCFAIWPTVPDPQKQRYAPGHNLIRHCTGQLPYLANGAAIYGAESNEIKDCLFVDISQGSAILLSTTFPTQSRDGKVNNNFSGVTIVEDCDIRTSGGFDHDWDWRAAVEICLDKRNIGGVILRNMNIENSFSNGISIIAKKGASGENPELTDAVLQKVIISHFGIGTKESHALFISSEAQGNLVIKNAEIPESKNQSVNFRVSS